MPNKAGGASANKQNNIDIAKMTKEQLEVYSARLLEEMEREREERNFFQIERDKIQTFWDISKQQLNESRTANRILKKEAQDFSKKFERESLQARKKLAHLVHAYQNETANINIENMVALKKFQNQYLRKKSEIIGQNNERVKLLNELNIASLNQCQAIKLQHRQTLEKTKDEFKQNVVDVQNKYDDKLAAYRQRFSLKHNMEIMEVEERKNEHANTLIKEHERAFEELKSFYNSVLLNNLSVIDHLKNKFSLVKKNELKMISQLKDMKT